MGKRKVKRKFGDRQDGALIRDIDALHVMTANLYVNRSDNEAYISEEIELDPLYRWLDAHKDADGEFPYTFFHLIVTALLRTIILRPKLNRFIMNKRYYQRFETTAAFVVKKKFSDEAEEGMAMIGASEDSTVFTVHDEIKKHVCHVRSEEDANKTEFGMEFFRKAPHFLTRFLLNFIRWFDRHGWMPMSWVEGDGDFASAFITNLGSIKLKCGYHHLSNWGTTSMFVVIGEKKMRPKFAPDGTYTMRETLNIGLTIDERIADGYYYSKSVRLLKHLLENPELLERPMGEEVDY